MWLNQNQNSATMLTQTQSLFPTLKSVLNDSSFLNASSAFFGGQDVNQTFVAASNEVNTSFQWSPFQDYVYTQWGNDIGMAVDGKLSYTQAIQKFQMDLVNHPNSH